MIPDLGPHAVFIWSSYALTATVLLALAAWLVLAGRAQARALKSLGSGRLEDQPPSRDTGSR